MNFQNMILKLNDFWLDNGCILQHGCDLEVGAGTFHQTTMLKCLGPEPWKTAYVQTSRRPTDGRYGENPNRLQQYYQYQVLLKPSPTNIQKVYLNSLKFIGINITAHDIRFIEDNWESPTLGATGLGWEVWLDGMEITQFTYFQQMGSINLHPISVELTYGLERICMYLQKKDNVFELNWSDEILYGDIHYQNEVEQSIYNFEKASTNTLFNLFNNYELEANKVINENLVIPSYEYTLKCSHCFNILDARRALSVLQRTNYISRIRSLSKKCASKYIKQKKALDYSIFKKNI